jgi:hemerythrin
MTIAWDPTLLVGDPEIDGQHQELFRRLDGLIEAIRGGRSRDEVGRTISFLHEYVVKHFAAEETLMVARGYPGLPDHRTEHDAYVNEIRLLEEELGRDGPTPSLTVRVSTQLNSFLRSHILRTDRAMIDWVKGTQRG